MTSLGPPPETQSPCLPHGLTVRVLWCPENQRLSAHVTRPTASHVQLRSLTVLAGRVPSGAERLGVGVNPCPVATRRLTRDRFPCPTVPACGTGDGAAQGAVEIMGQVTVCNRAQ